MDGMAEDDLLAEFTLQTMMDEWRAIERHVELHVQPRPRWLPERVWRRILRRLLVIRISQPVNAKDA
jgi:hypothetical protein